MNKVSHYVGVMDNRPFWKVLMFSTLKGRVFIFLLFIYYDFCESVEPGSCVLGTGREWGTKQETGEQHLDSFLRLVSRLLFESSRIWNKVLRNRVCTSWLLKSHVFQATSLSRLDTVVRKSYNGPDQAIQDNNSFPRGNQQRRTWNGELCQVKHSYGANTTDHI